MNLALANPRPHVAPAARRLDVRFVPPAPMVVPVRQGVDTWFGPVKRDSVELRRQAGWTPIRTRYAAGVASLTTAAQLHAGPAGFQHFAYWSRLARAEFQPMKYLLSAGIIGLLVFAWVLTDPIFQLLDRMTRRSVAHHFPPRREDSSSGSGAISILTAWLWRKPAKGPGHANNTNAAS